MKAGDGLRSGVRFGALLLAGVAVLSGCAGATLIDLNRDYVDLLQQRAELETLSSDDPLHGLDREASRESVRAAFAALGDEALTAAERAGDPRSEASLASVAARSYLASGAAGEARLADATRRGIEACADPALASGAGGLPTTCGSFHALVALGLGNQRTRELEAVRVRQRAVLETGGRLAAEDGRRLQAIFDGYMDALDRLAEADVPGRVDWMRASPELRAWYRRQQTLLYCNMGDAETVLEDVVADDPAAGWARAPVRQRMREELAAWRTRLEARADVGFRSSDCRRR